MLGFPPPPHLDFAYLSEVIWGKSGSGGWEKKKNLTARLPNWKLQITGHSVQSVLYLDLWGDNSRSYKDPTCDLARLTSLLRRSRRAEEKQTRAPSGTCYQDPPSRMFHVVPEVLLGFLNFPYSFLKRRWEEREEMNVVHANWPKALDLTACKRQAVPFYRRINGDKVYEVSGSAGAGDPGSPRGFGPPG